MVADAGYPVASDEPSILVADAIVDTVTGVVIWDRRYSLSYHLRSVIRTRTSNHIKRARRCVHVPLESVGERDELVAQESVGGDQSPARPDAVLESLQVVRELCGEVRARSISDPPLTMLLDAYTAGCDKPREIMKLTGMTRAEFVNVRRRLDRMLAKVPSELRRAALDAMRGGPALSSRSVAGGTEDHWG